MEKKEKDRYTAVKSASKRRGQIIIERPKIPRPPNAFMIFANEWRKKLCNQYPS